MAAVWSVNLFCVLVPINNKECVLYSSLNIYIIMQFYFILKVPIERLLNFNMDLFCKQ